MISSIGVSMATLALPAVRRDEFDSVVPAEAGHSVLAIDRREETIGYSLPLMAVSRFKFWLWLAGSSLALSAGSHLQAQIPPPARTPGGAVRPPAPPPAAGPLAPSPAPKAAGKIDGLTPEIESFLKRFAAAYRTAKTYRDGGRAVIVQQNGKVKLTTEAPMTLAFARPNRFRLDAGQYEAGCDGKSLVFTVPSTRQFTLKNAPAALDRRELPSGSVLGAAEDGHPEVLDLLTRDDAMKTLLGNTAKIGWRPDERVAGIVCRVLETETATGTRLHLYIDATRLVLIKVAGDYAAPVGSDGQPAGDSMKLVYELAPVEIDAGLEPDVFALPPTDGFQKMLSIGGDPAPVDEPARKMPEGGHLIDKPLPALKGTDLAGQPLNEPDLKGRVILIFFWSATGSEHSLTSIPLIQQIADQNKDRADFSVIAINTDPEPHPLATQILERKKASFRCLTDEDRALRRAFDLAGVPTFILADSHRIVRWAKLGAPPTLKNEIEEQIGKLLKTK